MTAGEGELQSIPCPRCGGQAWTEEVRWWCDACPEAGVGSGRGLVCYDVGSFLELAIRKREALLGEWKRERDLSMLYGDRGVGKTLAALSLAYAVSTGGRFLRWQAPRPRTVVYVDGEMQADALQERLRQVAAAQGPGFSCLRLICADLQTRAVPSLASRRGQEMVEEHLDGVDLLILDNISSLFGGQENDAEAWQPAQDWLLALRREGVAVLLLHHTGKSGSQRGTSRREDALDNSILLERPEGYRASDGGRFVLRFTKHRHLPGGPEVAPFEATFATGPDGAATWELRDLGPTDRDRVRQAAGDGARSVRQIAAETGIPKSTVHRHLAALGERLDGAAAGNGSRPSTAE